MEPVSLTALIIAVLVGVSQIIQKLHVKKCKIGCMNSECMTPINTPPPSEKDLEYDETFTNINNILKLQNTPNTKRKELEINSTV